jgi:GT2 family glycosyltransferase
MTVSIITPWLDHSELCQVYERGVQGAEVIVIDNGSQPEHAAKIAAMLERLSGKYIRNEDNRFFAPANNQGLQVATGEIVLFLNNDVELRAGFLEQVKRDVKHGGLYGPSKGNRYGEDYIEGWCIAGMRDDWSMLNGWPEDMPGMYWEDNVLCFRAKRQGMTLHRTSWPAWHYSNYTSCQTPGAYDTSAANARFFMEELQCS